MFVINVYVLNLKRRIVRLNLEKIGIPVLYKYTLKAVRYLGYKNGIRQSRTRHLIYSKEYTDY